MKYRFDPFVFDPGEHRLLRNGEEIHLQPKTFDTLALLLKNRGHLVTKDQLMSHLWPDLVVTEHSLTRCIREVRKALGDDPALSRYIETVPKSGYRFVAEVEEVSQAPRGGQTDAVTPRMRKGWLVGAGAAVLFLAAWLWWSASNESPAQLPVLAILPFENLTDDPDKDLVMRGLTQDIRERLASSGQLVIISGVSAAVVSENDPSHEDWPGALDADWLLTGIAIEDEKHHAVIVTLTSAEDGPAWEETVRIISGDLIGLAEKVSNLAADSLGVALPAQARYLATAASVESINAHQQYLLARGLIAQRNPESMTRAIQLLHQVLELKPDHPGAMAALGICYILSPERYYPSGVALERAAGLFDEALQINPDLALAWAGRSLALISQDSDLDLLREYIERALELNPYDADVLAWAANLAGSEGRINDAFQYLSRALKIDPLHTTVIGNLSFNLVLQGRYDQATTLLETAETRLGSHPSLVYFKVSIATSTGNLRRALEQSQEAVLGFPQGLFFAGQLATAYAYLQLRDQAYEWVSRTEMLGGRDEQRLGSALNVYGQFGDEEALMALILTLRSHPLYDDSKPADSARWLLEQLIEGHGRLLECDRVIELAGYRIGDPEALQGTRGSVASIANIAHWVAFCLQRNGVSDEANAWLVKIADQFDFMKLHGLGDSISDMYVEAQNLLLQGKPQAALDKLEAIADIGWLNQGALQHDPRWMSLREEPRFKALLDNAIERTSQIRDDIIEDDVIMKFEEAFAETEDPPE